MGFWGRGDIPITFKKIIGLPDCYGLSIQLVHNLSHRGIMFVSQTIRVWSLGAPIFKNADQLGLPAHLADEWEVMRDAFRAVGFNWKMGGDQIEWNGPCHDGAPIVKEVYGALNLESYGDQLTSSFYPFWRRKIPTKIVLFGWLVSKGRILTGENLNRRGFSGPFRCQICCMELETIDHLFFRCSVTARMWKLFSNHHMGAAWVPSDFLNVALEWDNLQGKYKSLPFYFVWEVWKGRNRLIFDGVPFQISQIYAYIHAWLDDRPVPCAAVIDCSKRNRPHEISLPAIYFDGACAEGLMGCGAWVKISQRERVHVHWNAGWGTNNKAELIALWGALRLVVYLQLQGVHVYGDSQIVIGWIVGQMDMMSPDLLGWLHRVRGLWDRLNRPPITHIYRESNSRADGLSRKGLESDFGMMHIQLFRDNQTHWQTSIPIP